MDGDDFSKRLREFDFLFTSPCENIVVTAARGGGKTVATLQSVVWRLLAGPSNGSALFFSATLRQAKKTTETPMRMITGRYPPGFCRYNMSEHCYRFFVGPNDVRELLLMSYEDKETKRGYHPEIIVLDECGSMPYDMLGTVILPMLGPARERGVGKLIAIGTARHNTIFHHLWKRGKSAAFPDWESYTLKADQCTLLGPQYLWNMQNTLTRAEYAQEFECDFDANVLAGSVYGEFMQRFTDPHISDCWSWDPTLPVWTAWDLGFTDYTAIWFFQVKGDRITFIDFFEDNGQTIPYYADVLLKKPYSYRMAILPHDGGANNVRGAPVREQLNKYGLRTEVLRNESEQTGINAARTLLQTALFNKTACMAGIGHLRSFKYKIDWKTGEKTGTNHDEHSHCADAFRYAAMARSIWMRGSGATTVYRPAGEYSVLY
jgi:hypothetical protein